MSNKIYNLFNTSELNSKDGEQFNTLLENDNIKLEQIVSFGSPTPPEQWYDQTQTEWVALLQGKATIQFSNGSFVELLSGDTLLIKAHEKHRVEKVSEDALWLALFIK